MKSKIKNVKIELETVSKIYFFDLAILLFSPKIHFKTSVLLFSQIRSFSFNFFFFILPFLPNFLNSFVVNLYSSQCYLSTKIHPSSEFDLEREISREKSSICKRRFVTEEKKIIF